jgi:hypothetical protein
MTAIKFMTDPDGGYVVTGQCLECGAPFITGEVDGPEGRTYNDECVGCGEKQEHQREAFWRDQRLAAEVR